MSFNTKDNLVLLAALLLTLGLVMIGKGIGVSPPTTLHEQIAPRIHATPISGIPNPEPPPVNEPPFPPTAVAHLLVVNPETAKVQPRNYSVIVNPCESLLRDWYCRVIYPPNYGTAGNNS